MIKLDIAGRRFGRLVALSPANRLYQGKSIWHCVCDCGNEADVLITYLTNGNTKSCGCLKQEIEQVNLRSKYDNKRIDGVATHLFTDKPRKDTSTGYRGVSKYYTRKSKQERYRAWITVKGKRYYKSGFLTAEDAYINGRKELEKLYLPK